MANDIIRKLPEVPQTRMSSLRRVYLATPITSILQVMDIGSSICAEIEKMMELLQSQEAIVR